MKACRFCAEDIQDAAIVCKHCGRDLETPAVVPVPRRRWKIPLIVGVLFVAFLIASYVVGDHQRFLAFAKERDAWHARCDRYRATTVSSADAAAARDCQLDLEQLLATAQREGWQ